MFRKQTSGEPDSARAQATAKPPIVQIGKSACPTFRTLFAKPLAAAIFLTVSGPDPLGPPHDSLSCLRHR